MFLLFLATSSLSVFCDGYGEQKPTVVEHFVQSVEKAGKIARKTPLFLGSVVYGVTVNSPVAVSLAGFYAGVTKMPIRNPRLAALSLLASPVLAVASLDQARYEITAENNPSAHLLGSYLFGGLAGLAAGSSFSTLGSRFLSALRKVKP